MSTAVLILNEFKWQFCFYKGRRRKTFLLMLFLCHLFCRDWCITSETGLFNCIFGVSNLSIMACGHLICQIVKFNVFATSKCYWEGPKIKMDHFEWAQGKAEILSKFDHFLFTTILLLIKSIININFLCLLVKYRLVWGQM